MFPLVLSEGPGTLISGGAIRGPLVLTRSHSSGARASALDSGGTGLSFFDANQPRFSGPSRRLLIEGQATNGVSQPIRVSNATGAWFQFDGTATPSITLNYAVAPDGTQTAARVRWVGPNTGFVSLRVPTSGVPANVQSTLSFWVFSRSLGNATSLGIDAGDFGSPTANLLPQFQVGAWRRVTGQVTPNASSSPWLDFSFNGFTTGEIDIDVWGVQVEQGAFASSLIIPPAATPGASTRGVDLISAPLANLGILSSGTCTVLWSGVIPAFVAGGVHTIACLDDGSVNNRLTMRVDQASGQLQAQRSLAGASTTANAGAVTAGAFIRGGMVLSGAGRAAVSLGGGAVAAVTGGPSSGLTQFRLGNISDSTAPMWGETSQLIVLPYPLPDVDLQAAVQRLK